MTIYGAKLYVHWSAMVMAGVLFCLWIRHPGYALEVVTCYFAMILLHEAGHAAMARRLGYSCSAIYLSLLHGFCVCEKPASVKEECLIAWGGVLAQLLIAVPLIAVAQLPVISAWPAAGIVIAILGYISLLAVAQSGADSLSRWLQGVATATHPVCRVSSPPACQENDQEASA